MEENFNRQGAEERQAKFSVFGVPRRFGGSIILLVVLAGCNDERRYIGDPPVVQVAITGATAPALTSEETAIFVVEQRIELPIREPSQTTLADLQTAAGKFQGLPFPRMPWVARDDLAVSVDFTLYNLDDQPHDLTVIVNGFNEFDEYVPGINIVDDELVIDFSQWERLYRVEGKQRLARTIREEELDEAAVDLATVVNGAPSSNQVVYFENLSDRDARSRAFIPKVVPGLAGFRIGLRLTGGVDEPRNVLLEATVKVREVEDRLADDGDDVFMLMPEPFMPVAPEL
jgi:hypothetical protein